MFSSRDVDKTVRGRKCDSMAGLRRIIEQRNQDEIFFQSGLDSNGNRVKIQVTNPGSEALNPAFDVTPAKYIKGIITEKGIISADAESIKKLFE